jgi:FtsZ-interacting cell division protein ZipA
MNRKAALALGIAIIAIIVLCLFSCSQEDKPQADTAGTQTAGQTADGTEEIIDEDPSGGAGLAEPDAGKDAKTDKEKESSTSSTNKKTDSAASSSGKTTTKPSGSSSSSGKTSGKTSTNGKDYGQGTPKPQGNSGNNGSGTNTDPQPQPQPPQPDPPAPVVDPMNWPDNEYTALLPKPGAGTVQKTDMQDGVYCLLLTGADMSDVKAYASALINAGYINDVTETVENGTYLFGGGNANGNFVVVSYQNGQFIIGVQP